MKVLILLTLSLRAQELRVKVSAVGETRPAPGAAAALWRIPEMDLMLYGVRQKIKWFFNKFDVNLSKTFTP